MKKAFEEYLIKNGYRQVTGSGNPSTVYDYCRRVDRWRRRKISPGKSWRRRLMIFCHAMMRAASCRRREGNPTGPSSTR